MKSKQVRAVVYSGKVGAKMTPKKHSTPTGTVKTVMRCEGGPMHRHKLYVASETTLTFTYKGRTGRYVAGKWEEVK